MIFDKSCFFLLTIVMNLNKHIRDYILTEASRKRWISNADLARNIGFTEATWSRIMRLKQKTIKDNVVNSICAAFGISPVDLLLISEGGNPHAVEEEPVPYTTKNPEIRRLIEWLETDARPDQIAAVLATARAVGLPNGSTNSSHSGQAESRSVA